MGFADLLIQLGIPYDHPEALRVGGEGHGFHPERGRKASRELALKGVLPQFRTERPEGSLGRDEKCHGDHDRAHRDHLDHRRGLVRDRADLCAGLCPACPGWEGTRGGQSPL